MFLPLFSQPTDFSVGVISRPAQGFSKDLLQDTIPSACFSTQGSYGRQKRCGKGASYIFLLEVHQTFAKGVLKALRSPAVKKLVFL